MVRERSESGHPWGAKRGPLISQFTHQELADSFPLPWQETGPRLGQKYRAGQGRHGYRNHDLAFSTLHESTRYLCYLHIKLTHNSRHISVRAGMRDKDGTTEGDVYERVSAQVSTKYRLAFLLWVSTFLTANLFPICIDKPVCKVHLVHRDRCRLSSL